MRSRLVDTALSRSPVHFRLQLKMRFSTTAIFPRDPMLSNPET